MKTDNLTILGHPIPTADPEEAVAALRALGIENMADIAQEDFVDTGSPFEDDVDEPTPRQLKYLRHGSFYSQLQSHSALPRGVA